MIIKKNTIENATIFLTLEVDLKEMENFRNEAYKYYRSNFSFNGFREGKASNEIIDKQVDKEKMINMMARFYIADFLKNFLVKEKIGKMSYNPSIKIMNDILKDGKAIFNIELYLMPSVELGDYKNIATTVVPEEKITDQEIEAAIYEIRRAYGSRKEVAGPVKKGDLVTLHYKISFEDNLLPDEERRVFMVKVGDGSLPKGFEDNILGLYKSEERTFKFVFPKDYFDKKMQGLGVNIWLKLLKVEVEKLPELTDEWVKKISHHHNAQEFTEAIKKQIEDNRRDLQRKKILNEKIRKLIDTSRFVVPSVFYYEEKKVILGEIKKELEARGEDVKAWFDNNLVNKDVVSSLENEAVYRVKSRLILEAIAKKENLLPNPQEITNFLHRYIKYAYNKTESGEHIKTEKMKHLAASLLMQQKAAAFLVSA